MTWCLKPWWACSLFSGIVMIVCVWCSHIWHRCLFEISWYCFRWNSVCVWERRRCYTTLWRQTAVFNTHPHPVCADVLYPHTLALHTCVVKAMLQTNSEGFFLIWYVFKFCHTCIHTPTTVTHIHIHIQTQMLLLYEHELCKYFAFLFFSQWHYIGQDCVMMMIGWWWNVAVLAPSLAAVG